MTLRDKLRERESRNPTRYLLDGTSKTLDEMTDDECLRFAYHFVDKTALVIMPTLRSMGPGEACSFSARQMDGSGWVHAIRGDIMTMEGDSGKSFLADTAEHYGLTPVDMR